jgi:GT2 family glycosyltransferase
MDLNLKNITFIIVSFRSEQVIYNCLDSIPNVSNKIIIENSQDINLKKDLESKYDNIEVILNKNLGMGVSNNIGIKRSQTQYVYVLNPDVTLRKNTLDNLIHSIKDIEDFAIISPLNSDLDYPNYKNEKEKNENIIEVSSIDGFSMIINKKKFNDDYFFDENIFLYLENDDLCLRTKEKRENIYIIKNSLIDHLGASSSNKDQNNELEYSRNWHWMWSKFYFNKKHYGYLNALKKVFLNLISAKIKFIFYLITLNSHKRKIYQMRISGILNSMLGKESWYR